MRNSQTFRRLLRLLRLLSTTCTFKRKCSKMRLIPNITLKQDAPFRGGLSGAHISSNHRTHTNKLQNGAIVSVVNTLTLTFHPKLNVCSPLSPMLKPNGICIFSPILINSMNFVPVHSKMSAFLLNDSMTGCPKQRLNITWCST
jgi:hypothetical protein